MSALMDIIYDCENRLGWSPPIGAVLWKARAAEHRKLTMAMQRHGYDEKDLRLALNYCIRRKQPIASPLELVGIVATARDLAAPRERTLDLATEQAAAIAWEQMTSDVESAHWVSRLVRSVGPVRADVLIEWRQAGRGDG